MSVARPHVLTKAWLMLAAITLISFATAEFLALRPLAVAAVMAISAIKVVIILCRFMDVAGAPIGVRAYMLTWPVACGAMIFTLWWIA